MVYIVNVTVVAVRFTIGNEKMLLRILKLRCVLCGKNTDCTVYFMFEREADVTVMAQYWGGGVTDSDSNG